MVCAGWMGVAAKEQERERGPTSQRYFQLPTLRLLVFPPKLLHERVLGNGDQSRVQGCVSGSEQGPLQAASVGGHCIHPRSLSR